MRDRRGRLRARTELAAWFALVGAAGAWTLHLVLGYGIEEVACSPGTRGQTLAGVSPELLIAVLTAALGAVALAALAAALVLTRSVTRGRTHDPRGRIAFMARGGVLAGVLFLVMILLGGFQVLGLEACAT